jgi:hypothetical protein
MRVPVSRPRLVWLPVGDEAPVGGLGLASDLQFCLAQRLVSGPDAGLTLAAWGAGGELEPAQLLAGQGGPAEGVVLLARE